MQKEIKIGDKVMVGPVEVKGTYETFEEATGYFIRAGNSYHTVPASLVKPCETTEAAQANIKQDVDYWKGRLAQSQAEQAAHIKYWVDRCTHLERASSKAGDDLKHWKDRCQALEKNLEAKQRTGLTPEGWLIDGASEGELAAYDTGCDEAMAAVQNVLKGKDIGAGVEREPWQSLREQLIDMVRKSRAWGRVAWHVQGFQTAYGKGEQK